MSAYTNDSDTSEIQTDGEWKDDNPAIWLWF